MRHFRHPSLSIRRFWGKGERWKRKRERATVWPSSGACVANISLFFNLQWGVFEYLYNITGIIACFKNCVSVRSPTLSFVNKRAPENCKLLLFTELHQALVWQLKSWCYTSYPRAVERSCKNKWEDAMVKHLCLEIIKQQQIPPLHGELVKAVASLKKVRAYSKGQSR